MAFVQAHFFSPAIGKQVQAWVILPDGAGLRRDGAATAPQAGPFPVFYLLHGLSDDHTIWVRRTRIESYVEGVPLIVVMPDGFRSFYTDHTQGPPFAKYMAEDLVGFIDRTFPTIKERSGRCIGGLSMGGYGALRLALGYPQLFVSANSHSGSLGGIEPKRFGPCENEMRNIVGAQYEGSSHDLVALARKLKENGAGTGGQATSGTRTGGQATSGTLFPQIRIDCGTEDFLLDGNRYFHRELTKLGVPHEYQEFPGAHTWDYWDEHVREALAFHRRALGI